MIDLDKSWTKEETDYMLSLCRTYGLRFPVIEDRYDFKGGRRTVVVCAVLDALLIITCTLSITVTGLVGPERSLLQPIPSLIEETARR